MPKGPMVPLPAPQSRGARGSRTRALAGVGGRPEVPRPDRVHACCSPPRPPRRPAPVWDPQPVSGLSHPRPQVTQACRPPRGSKAQNEVM